MVTFHKDYVKINILKWSAALAAVFMPAWVAYDSFSSPATRPFGWWVGSILFTLVFSGAFFWMYIMASRAPKGRLIVDKRGFVAEDLSPQEVPWTAVQNISLKRVGLGFRFGPLYYLVFEPSNVALWPKGFEDTRSRSWLVRKIAGDGIILNISPYNATRDEILDAFNRAWRAHHQHHK